jgi:pyridoxamine 5'-phosphate oxidase
MSIEDCIAFANANPVSYLATAEGDQPHVRGMLMWFADGTGFYYHTASTKSLCKQLKANPRVEACFLSQAPPEEGGGRMLRVAGTVEFLKDPDLAERLLAERPFLQAIVHEGTEDLLAIFRITNGEAWFWTMVGNMREAELPKFQF